MTIVPSNEVEYYKGQVYWNDFEEVIRYQNKLISGDDNLYWRDYLTREYGTFDVGFFPNCGNGWVERDLYSHKVIKKAVAFDISETLIESARTEAAIISMPAQYFVHDVNSFDPKDMTCDIVVNVGAMHHVAYIDRMTRNIVKLLRRGGIYVGMDYVGPHRNQYPWNIWAPIIEFNETLPVRYKRFQKYAHIKTMINLDPTEAIHSELQIIMLNRYFDILQYTPLGGAIAYQIMFENRCLFSERHTREGSEVVRDIIRQDQMSLEKSPENTLFAFWVATPRRDALMNSAVLYHWEREEEERERRAAINGDRYYPVSALEIIYDEIVLLNDALTMARESARNP